MPFIRKNSSFFLFSRFDGIISYIGLFFNFLEDIEDNTNLEFNKISYPAYEKIEDEYDVTLADEAYKEYVDNGCKSQPIDELWNELGIH